VHPQKQAYGQQDYVGTEPAEDNGNGHAQLQWDSDSGPMAITQQQMQAARAIQHAAAHDNSAQVRLVAGPGSYKSIIYRSSMLGVGSTPTRFTCDSFMSLRSSRMLMRQM
jgi:hypothetical protein